MNLLNRLPWRKRRIEAVTAALFPREYPMAFAKEIRLISQSPKFGAELKVYRHSAYGEILLDMGAKPHGATHWSAPAGQAIVLTDEHPIEILLLGDAVAFITVFNVLVTKIINCGSTTGAPLRLKVDSRFVSELP